MNLIFSKNIGHMPSVCFTPHSVNLPQHCRGSLGSNCVLRTRAVGILSKVYLVYCTNTCLIMVHFTICEILLFYGSKNTMDLIPQPPWCWVITVGIYLSFYTIHTVFIILYWDPPDISTFPL